MNFMKNSFLKRALVFVFFLSALSHSISAQAGSKHTKKSSSAKIDDIGVTIGQPRHWTLDDAHYLLSGLHHRARAIQITAPQTIDPNAIHSTRIDQRETIVSGGVEFNQLTGKANEIALENLNQKIEDADQARLDQTGLESELDQARVELSEATLNRAGINSEIAKLTAQQNYETFEKSLIEARRDKLSPENEEDKPNIDDLNIEIEKQDLLINKTMQNIAVQQANLLTINQQVSNAEAKIETITQDISSAQSKQTELAATFTPTAASAPNPIAPSAGLGTSQLQAFNDSQASANQLVPNFPPSVVLDNYVDAENIALAKKLTLLRKELGEDKTVMFLELPHSIQSARKTSDNRHVQVYWEVESYCQNNVDIEIEKLATSIYNAVAVNPSIVDVRASSTVSEFNNFSFNPSEINSIQSGLFSDYEYLRFEGDDDLENLLDQLARDYLSTFVQEDIGANKEPLVRRISEDLRSNVLNSGTFDDIACARGKQTYSVSTDGTNKPVAWDLIPKSDAYNVASFNLDRKRSAFSAAFSFLTGFGLSAEYQKNKELFEQFATRDVFGSAFGQGEHKFGWVFNPKPGADRIPSGTKTTYAALTLPSDATLVNLKATHCVLGSKEVPYSDISTQLNSNCGKSVSFKLPVQRDNNFWVEGARYNKARSGETSTIIFSGRKFSPFQLSVLVDGSPLEQFDGTNVTTREVANTTNGAKGYFEITNSKTIVLNFKMPTGYKGGTPVITFLTPGRSVSVNDFYLKINGKPNRKLGLSDALFAAPVDPFTLSLNPSSPPLVRKEDKSYFITLRGSDFSRLSQVRVGDASISSKCSAEPKVSSTRETKCAYNIVSDGLLVVEVPDAKSWPIFLISNEIRDESARNTSNNLVLSKHSEVLVKSKSVSILVEKPEEKKEEVKPKPKAAPKLLTVSSVEILDVVSLEANPAKYRLNIKIIGGGFDESAQFYDVFGDLLENQEVAVLSKTEMYLKVDTANVRLPFILKTNVGQKNEVKEQGVISWIQPPVLNSVAMANGSSNICGAETGGTNLLITGSGLNQVTEVLFGVSPATIGSKTQNTLIVSSPPGQGSVILSAISNDAENEKKYVSVVGENPLIFKYSPHKNCTPPKETLFGWN